MNIRTLIFTACCLVTLAGIGIGLAAGLRRSPAVQDSAWRDDEPIPYRLADPDPDDALLSVITCCRCKNSTGPCECKVRCTGHGCRGRLTLTTWNDHDFEFAARHRFSLEERSERQ